MSVPVRSATELAAEIRGIIADCQDVLSAPDVDRGMDAVNALVALAERAEGLDGDGPQISMGRAAGILLREIAVRKAAEARVAELERELAEAGTRMGDSAAARMSWLEIRVAELEQEAERWKKAHDMAADMYADRAARVAELGAELARLHNDLGGESMRCERAEGRVAELETALRETLDALERGDIYGAEYVRRWNNARQVLAAGSPTGQEQQA